MTPRLPLSRSLPGRAPLRVSARFVSSHAGTESRPSPARAALSLPLPGIALSEERCRAALMRAVTADDFALLRLTLAKMTGCGTNPDFRSMRGFSETPLALAVRLGRSLMIPALLRAGADIRQRTGKNSEPLLSAALRAGTWSSRAAREGLWHKAGSVAGVLVAALLDFALRVLLGSVPGLGIDYDVLLCPLVTAWYLLTELGSIAENAGALGAPMPQFLMRAIAALRAGISDRGGGDGDGGGAA